MIITGSVLHLILPRELLEAIKGAFKRCHSRGWNIFYSIKRVIKRCIYCFGAFHWVKVGFTECESASVVVENKDEIQCKYFHWGYVSHIMTHHLLIKVGTFNPLTPLNIIPFLRQWEIFFGWPPAGLINNSSWNNERWGFILCPLYCYILLQDCYWTSIRGQL